MIDIGRVFSTGFAMLRQRLWLLVGMWALFFVIQIGFSMVFGFSLGGLGMAGGAALAGGMDNPAALAGMGIGVILVSILFYIAYIALAFAQQGAMVALASPLVEPSFGEAMSLGFKSVLTFLGLMLVLIATYIAFLLVSLVITLVMGLAGETGAGIAALLIIVLAVPAAIYLSCRLSVLVGVVVVERVFNPIAALRRSWAITGGKVLGIFLVFLAFLLLAAVLVLLPALLIFGAVAAAGPGSTAGMGAVMLGVLLFFPLLLLYAIAASALLAALHAEVSGGGAEQLQDVFA
jgi:hypothetical protein